MMVFADKKEDWADNSPLRPLSEFTDSSCPCSPGLPVTVFASHVDSHVVFPIQRLHVNQLLLILRIAKRHRISASACVLGFLLPIKTNEQELRF